MVHHIFRSTELDLKVLNSMNILFLTMGKMVSIETHSLYTDLLRCFRDHGHEVYMISPYEKRIGKDTALVNESHAHILHVKTGNVTKSSNLIEKGLAQLSLERIYIKAIKKYFSDIKFDLVMYSTPPITFYKAINFVKKRDGARSYLLLKDIFPQNAVDLGMMTTSGPKSILYKYFRRKEKKLYAISDRIGCMSPANVKYVLDHNPEVDPSKVEVCPNAIEVFDKSIDHDTRTAIRKKYEIPLDKTVFVYGGNLGKPQGIPFLIECLKAQCNDKAYYLIVGDGTEFCKLETYVNEFKPNNVRLMKRLPKEDYDTLVAACDIGMIFLDYRFTIPNFPSRLLSYLQAKLPVFACTDLNSDIGEIVENNGFGWKCLSDDIANFVNTCQHLDANSLKRMGETGFLYLVNNYSVDRIYNIIISNFEEK